ncbi:hypothetical protein ALEA_9 [Pseudomonas phage ALEA]|uniref:Uncharacterized protein n=1 Tax=Pseudomonas phage AH05 TaxID=2869574 RepID=A0AAE7X4G0_9CAUD|nr:hypothetical protein AH05_10 [Pseudomonas phage AH05]UAV89313.1 hypothetical protein ALEA_9 [Pseudomonas phage ALEA]UAV89412.1 hypothetical protein JOR_8 [Pseudomonas phage JOR]UAV89462.1 hypothetical protein M11_9 [Pseudomonas phage M1.1]UAV89511.1 hypothetical protein M12_8 [Pseudomonas phage M1.2]UAV89560.1 hypothetical protein M31_8 [Pseudomonas phage M3.1]UAV89783.1 hypothetical protein NOI_8 [Pseudomonas phage NOI]UAV90054.1 hypothetical protein SNK_8 [Pseudomonas phage SNK]
MIHTNYKPARRGLLAEKIASEKEAAIDATMRHPEAKASVMAAMYGGRRTLGAKAVADRFGNIAAIQQAMGLRYSDRGDFTRCYRGGF